MLARTSFEQLNKSSGREDGGGVGEERKHPSRMMV
jgi:hypothetical protein